MSRRRLVASLTATALATMLAGFAAAPPTSAAPSDPPVTYYFHGGPTDNVTSVTTAPTATFDKAAPTGTQPATQTMKGPGNQDSAGNFLGAFWLGAFSGPLKDDVELNWYFMSPNGEGVALGATADVTVYADYDVDAGTARKIGQKSVVLTLGAGPTLNVTRLTVDTGATPIASNLMIQVTSSADTGQALTAVYNSTDAPSRFVIPAPPAAAGGQPPAVVHAADLPVAFSAASVVSPTFFGAEPQTTMERPVAASLPGAIDPNRVFIDWPADTALQSGQLYRSMDGGDTFRQLVDKACAPRQRPNCASGGGGDTENEVNPVTGTLFFGDQEVVAQEALATSLDHGDTFPIQQQIAATAPATGVDRQWLAPLAPGIHDVGGQQIHGFYTYHVPLVGQYIVGITAGGLPIPQPAPQIAGVEQSGQVRVDNTDGPGRGWIYQPYRQGGNYLVATAAAADYASAAGWQVNTVANSNPTIFPWLSLDSHGNAYAVWVAGSAINYSFSKIDDPANNPTLSGRPGTKWSTPAVVDPPSIGSVVFPEIIAGDIGRVAISYDGTVDHTGTPDTAPVTAKWDTYVSVLTNAMAEGDQPIEVRTGKVSHRPVHIGTICTSGTTCTGDRSLLDMIDLGVDADGRVGVVFTDNNSTFQTTSATAARGGPFVHFAKQVAGPSLLASKPTVAVAVQQGQRSDRPGDATWPNASSGTNLSSLDELGASLALEGAELVARVKLADASSDRMTTDLATYAASGYSINTDRLQYVVRFSTSRDNLTAGTTGDVFHLSMDHKADGTRGFFGGKLDANDGLQSPLFEGVAWFNGGTAYHRDAAISVTGTVEGNTLVIRAPASAFGLVTGQTLYSVQAFAMGGPRESTTTAAAGDLGDRSYSNPMRPVDVTPAFDAVLGTPPDPDATVPEVPFGPLLPVAAALLLGAAVVRRHRSRLVRDVG
ncbi:MAG: hypothetical protein JJD92_06535 [Frankiaceae bacterium]|nr:hypothetical protein [Frankiaceae bacterium]